MQARIDVTSPNDDIKAKRQHIFKLYPEPPSLRGGGLFAEIAGCSSPIEHKGAVPRYTRSPKSHHLASNMPPKIKAVLAMA